MLPRIFLLLPLFTLLNSCVIYISIVSTYCLDIYIYIVIRVPYVYIYIVGKDSNLFPTLVILYSLVLKAAIKEIYH